MAATDVKFGITRHAGALIDAVDTSEKKDKKELRGSNGNIARVHTYNPTTSGTVKGHGTLTLVPGVGNAGISDVASGITVIDEVKRSESNEDFDGWEYSFTNYPNAQEVA